MIIIKALGLTFLGMGVVFLVLAIDFFSILVIGMFREEEQTDSGLAALDLEPGPVDGEKTAPPAEARVVTGESLSLITPESGRTPHREIAAAIMAAICAWEAEEERGRDYF